MTTLAMYLQNSKLLLGAIGLFMFASQYVMREPNFTNTVDDANKVKRAMTYEAVTDMIGHPTYPTSVTSDKNLIALWEAKDGHFMVFFNPDRTVYITSEKKEGRWDGLCRRVRWRIGQ
jgi:hypothetical protein